MGLVAKTVESQEDSMSLLSEIIATFEVNKSRISYTEKEFRELYRLYEEQWKPKYNRINGNEIAASGRKGGAA